MCSIDEDVDTTVSSHAVDHRLQQAILTISEVTTQMRLMMVGVAVLITVLMLGGFVLAITAGGMLADARTGYSAGLTGIIAACVMVVSWGALRGHLAILAVFTPVLMAVRDLRATVAEIQERQDRETRAWLTVATTAADEVAKRRAGG